MSETVHYRGVAKKIVPTATKTVAQIAEDLCKARDIKMSEYCVKYHNSSWLHMLSDGAGYHEYVIINGELYRIEKEDIDPDGDIIKATRASNGDIEFELRYYNGGAGFDECLEEAIDKLNKTDGGSN